MIHTLGHLLRGGLGVLVRVIAVLDVPDGGRLQKIAEQWLTIYTSSSQILTEGTVTGAGGENQAGSEAERKFEVVVVDKIIF